MKIPMVLSALSLCVVLMAYAADQSDDAKNIQGTWLPVKAELRGEPMKEEMLKAITLKLDGGKYEVMAENLDKGTYAIDAAAKPKTIDVTGVEGPNAGRKLPAIYELGGDTLRICYGLGGSPRPTEFKSPSGTKTFLVTYKRKKAN
jgi:uncharacterized protein (TIGR03067 family)